MRHHFFVFAFLFIVQFFCVDLSQASDDRIADPGNVNRTVDVQQLNFKCPTGQVAAVQGTVLKPYCEELSTSLTLYQPYGNEPCLSGFVDSMRGLAKIHYCEKVEGLAIYQPLDERGCRPEYVDSIRGLNEIRYCERLDDSLAFYRPKLGSKCLVGFKSVIRGLKKIAYCER